MVLDYYNIFSSHVGGMVGLNNKTKGLRFCNISGFLELYNDPEVCAKESNYIIVQKFTLLTTSWAKILN